MGKSTSGPWYGRVRRWGQTNITEIDPVRYDIRLLARALAPDTGAGRHHQRRRHRRLLPPEPVPAHVLRRAPGRPRPVRRARRSRARRRPGRVRADGFQPRARALLRRPSGLDGGRRERQAVHGRRPLRHLHRQPLLRGVPARGAPRDREPLPPRRLRATTAGPGSTAVTSPTARIRGGGFARPPAWTSRASPTGTTRPTASGSSGATRAAWRSGTSTTGRPGRRAARTASGSA